MIFLSLQGTGNGFLGVQGGDLQSTGVDNTRVGLGGRRTGASGTRSFLPKTLHERQMMVDLGFIGAERIPVSQILKNESHVKLQV